jgi:hypothetical protein
VVVQAIAEQIEDSETVNGKTCDGVHDQSISPGKIMAVPRNELDLITASFRAFTSADEAQSCIDRKSAGWLQSRTAALRVV